MAANIRNKLALGLVFGLLVVLATLLYTDTRELGQQLQSFRWGLLPIILGLQLC